MYAREPAPAGAVYAVTLPHVFPLPLRRSAMEHICDLTYVGDD